MTPRDLALETLNRSDDLPGSHERCLNAAFDANPDLDDRDRAFAVHLVQGVLRWQIRLDWIIRQSVRFPFRKIEPANLNILRLALYQILFMDRVPERAAVSEAVKQAGRGDSRRVAGFVNGILRRICREKAQLRFPDPVQDRDRYFSIYYAYPLWLVKKWVRELGPQTAEALLDAGNRLPDRVIRANTLKADREGLILQLQQEGVAASPCIFSPEGIRIASYRGAITRLQAFEKGLFQVQGESAQICSHLLAPMETDRVLDVCAGLGGKTTHLAALMENRGQVVALDRNHRRLTALMQSVRRLGAAAVMPLAADASGSLSTWLKGPFQKILVDGPCSGLGVLSRHPDAKLAKKEQDIERLAILQGIILDQAVQLLKQGGRVLYATCTLSREENEGVVEAFLRRHPGMRLENARRAIPPWGSELIDANGFFRTLPSVHGMDGFFGALFRRTGQRRRVVKS